MGEEASGRQASAGDGEQVARAKTDRAAFAALYDRLYPDVARYCRRRLFDRAAAEDVTSEVFLKVAAHFADFRGTTESDFRLWLFRIATNAVNEHLRQSLRRQTLLEAAIRSQQRSESDLRAAEAHEILDWSAVYQAILALDERDQSIITLRFFAGLSHAEIAQVIKATPGAVRTALSRTLQGLREKFAAPCPSADAAGPRPQG